MARKRYPTDLTDPEWERLAPLIPPAKPGADLDPHRCVRSSTASPTFCAVASRGV